jgi:class 3 adenylate cyclase
MLCDLIGSTELSTQLDPEDLREIIGTYHCAVAEAVARSDGLVAKYVIVQLETIKSRMYPHP